MKMNKALNKYVVLFLVVVSYLEAILKVHHGRHTRPAWTSLTLHYSSFSSLLCHFNFCSLLLCLGLTDAAFLSATHTLFHSYCAHVCTGDEICALSPPVGPNGAVPSTPASIILVDRQLDIMTPALHHAHLLDRIFGQHKAKHTGTHHGSGHARAAPLVGQSQLTETQGSSPTERPGEASEDCAAEAVQAAAGQVDVEAVKEGCLDADHNDLTDRRSGPEDAMHGLPRQQHQRQLPCNRAGQIYGLR
jgi:hypothetical protein